jgi:Mrp family chromosome partitioning ATPase/DUF971 family protein
MSKEAEVLDSLRGIIDPDLHKDIVTLGFVKNLSVQPDGRVSFQVELTTPACPVKAQFKSACEEAVSRLPWVTAVAVTMTAAERKNPLLASAPGLARVAHLVAVSSCKGGVGKSTVAVNLAYTLAHQGGRVGLFDADVYGPSLPTMVSPDSTDVYQKNNLIQPLAYRDVKLMSFGFVSGGPGGGPAIMRGPMVTQVINQLLTGTEWGELDYLVIDFPPGTGDIQLTLTQLIPLTAAVIVTTPQDLSFVDVVKGVQMFDKLKVPTVAVVENMSYFICPQCRTRHHLFGQGALRKLKEQFGIQNAVEIPIEPELSPLSDSGRPFVLERPDHPVTALYRELAAATVREISRIRYGETARPQVSYAKERGIVVTVPGGAETVIAPAALRRRCRCALCVEEMTGRPVLRPESVSEAIYPTAIQSMGNYAVAIQWSDGHTSSIYPYDTLLAAAAGAHQS